MKNKFVLVAALCCLLIVCVALAACQTNDVQLKLTDYSADYSVGSPIDVENHYTANVRTGITTKVAYNDGDQQQEKKLYG